MTWDRREHERQRRAFVNSRLHRHPMLSSATLIFAATWLFGWGSSALLLQAGVESMPLRYGLSFLLSYAVFFLCVRIWCNSVHHDRRHQDGFDLGGWDANEGCLLVLAVLLAAFTIAALFWATGGFAALLEAAFEVTFAGTVVRRLSRTEVVGRWATTLFVGTWLHALLALLLLVGIAAALQRAAPGATRFSQAAGVLWSKHAAAR
jgi:hypothetical protein